MRENERKNIKIMRKICIYLEVKFNLYAIIQVMKVILYFLGHNS